MNVEFIWWGSSELLDLLSLPANSGRVLFWFGSLGCFDQSWFETQIVRAAKSAGTRYTPELHVELPISEKFDAFGRNAEMVERIQGTGIRLQEKYSWIASWEDCSETPGLGTASEPLKGVMSSLMRTLDHFSEQPDGKQGFEELNKLAKQAIQSCSDIELRLDALKEHLRSLSDPREAKAEDESHQLKDRTSQMQRSLWDFEYELRSVAELYLKEGKFAEARILLLTGEAGTGKTHLLCDLAKQRIAENRPTILLLGQCFTTTKAPSVQVAELLGLPRASLQEIVSCLEAAAQAANTRCLILIDALNEGMGRQFWKPHLIEFVETIKGSPWLALVLSVRTCYANLIVPEAVQVEAVCVTHDGFNQVGHEAVKFFFLEHDIEFASAPIFSPDFFNPLFLKTLCCGLQRSGFGTFPRGFHGITRAFDLYLEAIDKGLAEQLDYPQSQKLAKEALQSLVRETMKAKRPFLPVIQAGEVVDRLLPGRDYSRSLYKALVDSGLLMESMRSERGGEKQDVVCIAYERWADHLEAKALLDEHLDSEHPAKAFKIGGPLALYGEGFSMRGGIREALSIQVPERLGRELLSLMPYGLRECGMADAFLHSVVWREPAACTPITSKLMNFFEWHELAYNHDVWDVRLTVATIPGHPLNMDYMDHSLRRLSMPDRDAIWSIEIYKAWEEGHSICHLVDWAWRIERGAPLERESVWLAALTLCWCFTTSHRFLRDRATKAAVNLLDDRLEIATDLVKHFANVDDLYVRERVLAVACGVALRSYSAKEVGGLAEVVHETVFASGIPPAHILLRDYARCVIERAVYLGFQPSFDPAISNPPYLSIWPLIPSKEEVEALKTGWSEIGKSRPDEERAKNEILNSVLDDDFARYVIGTNSWHTDWLSIRMDEPEWVPASDKIEAIIATLAKKQQRQWRALERLRKSHPTDYTRYLSLIRGGILPTISAEEERLIEKRISTRNKLIEGMQSRLDGSLDVDVSNRLKALIKEQDRAGGDRPPRFDLSLIQRYVAKRVFDLGWTVERFGRFDIDYPRGAGRDAMKPERIGKKYQWIAYHEITALIADHFRYNEDRWGGGRAESYEGPWQEYYRDIDPTHGIKALPDTSKHRKSWWETVCYDNWRNDLNAKEWAMDASDYPNLPSLLSVTDPQGVRWINAYGFYNWKRKRPPSQGYDDEVRREVWTNFHAWLVKRSETRLLIDWLNGIDVGNRWMPHQLPHDISVFFAEHAWARASLFHEHPYYGHEGWRYREGCPVEVFSIPAEYLEERSTFDCSMDESFTLLLPNSMLTRQLRLRWTGRGADFETENGVLFATDPRAHEGGKHCLLLREDLLKDYLEANQLSLVWAVSGEKNHYGNRHSYDKFFGLRFSGAFEWSTEGINGSIRHYDRKDRSKCGD